MKYNEVYQAALKYIKNANPACKDFAGLLIKKIPNKSCDQDCLVAITLANDFSHPRDLVDFLSSEIGKLVRYRESTIFPKANELKIKKYVDMLDTLKARTKY